MNLNKIIFRDFDFQIPLKRVLNKRLMQIGINKQIQCSNKKLMLIRFQLLAIQNKRNQNFGISVLLRYIIIIKGLWFGKMNNKFLQCQILALNEINHKTLK